MLQATTGQLFQYMMQSWPACLRSIYRDIMQIRLKLLAAVRKVWTSERMCHHAGQVHVITNGQMRVITDDGKPIFRYVQVREELEEALLRNSLGSVSPIR
jgi:hypothetical protein